MENNLSKALTPSHLKNPMFYLSKFALYNIRKQEFIHTTRVDVSAPTDIHNTKYITDTNMNKK
jgi:hypothetical protein